MASQGDLEDRTFWTAECPWPRCMTRVVDARPWDVRQTMVLHFKFQHGLTYEVSHQSTWFAVTTAHRHTHTLTHTTRVRSLRLLLAVASNVRKLSTKPLQCLMEKRSCRGIPSDDCRSRSSSTRRDQWPLLTSRFLVDKWILRCLPPSPIIGNVFCHFCQPMPGLTKICGAHRVLFRACVITSC